MSYVRARGMTKRFKQDRRVSGADILRKELDLDPTSDATLLQENSELARRGPPQTSMSTVVSAGDADGEDDDGRLVKISRNQMSSEDFELWIKLASDNKINTSNSWNLALIDYFHEMSLLKEGDNINFQKASATLDGCVKIYSSRVDSVATETGRLLTGLATKKDGPNGEADDEDGDDDGEDEDENRQRKKTNRARHVASTLVSFDSIKMKKLDQELDIDPLFKRALSEFDEGGAKSLLLNILSINSDGRIVFDAAGKGKVEPIEEEEENAEDIENSVEEPSPGPKTESTEMQRPSPQNDRDVLDLASMLFGQPSDLEKLEICPSMSNLAVVLEDIHQAKSLLSDVNAGRENFAPMRTEMPTYTYGDDIDTGYEYGDEIENGGDPIIDEPDNGNEDIAGIIGNDEGGDDDGDNNKEDYAFTDLNSEENVPVMEKIVDTDLMAYFDQNMRTHWAGPEHWKVSALKRRGQKPVETQAEIEEKAALRAAKKKKKAEFRINFTDIGDDQDDSKFEESIFQPGKNIDIPKHQQNSDDKHLLPRDVLFSSKRLLRLFTKPENIGFLRKRTEENGGILAEMSRNGEENDGLNDNEAADENFWANRYEQAEAEPDQNEQQEEFYDAQDYADDGFGFDDEVPESQPFSLNTQSLVMGARRIRPEYLNYSRTAKRVDVKFLKDNLWKSLQHESGRSQADGVEDVEQNDIKELKPVHFTSVVDGIGKMYQKEEKKDLSTSFCFICLLHLANEHGLTIKNEDDKFEDLEIVYGTEPIKATQD